MTYAELSAQAAALERDHDYAAANKKWTDAAKTGNESQSEYATQRADLCAMAIARAWA